MKRHTVMDLFHSHQTEVVDAPWNDVEKELPKAESCKVKVKTTGGEERFAYYYADMGRLQKYMDYTSHFWCSSSHEPIFDVMQWKGLV